MLVKILLLFFVFSFLLRTDHSFDQDLGRHLKLGEIIVKTHQIPKTNLFSYTNADFPFINTHWLFEVFVYLISQTIGLWWLLIIKVLIFLTSLWLIIKTIPKQNQILLIPLGFIFLHVLRERLELRPEIFSFLFTSLTLYILNKFTKVGGKLIYLLPFIQLIWVNTHIYFFIGLLLQAIFLIHTGYEQLRSQKTSGRLRALAIIFILSTLISLINPNGLAGLLYPLSVNKNYGYTIVENQTMFLLESINFTDPNFLFVKLAAGIIVLSLVVGILKRSGELKNYLLAISGLALALLNVRSFPYLVFISLPAVLQNFGEIKRSSFTFILLLVTCFLLLFESFFYLNGDYYRFKDEDKKVGLKMEESVKGAMNFVLSHNLEGPIYNNFDIGSYITYKAYPKYKIFVDGRPEAYPKEFFQQVYMPMQSDHSKFEQVEKQYGFKTIIFSHTDQTPWGKAFLQNVVKDQEWKLVYIDDFMTIFVKSDSSLAEIDLNKLDPSDFHYTNHVSYLRIAIFLLTTQNTDSGRKFLQRTLQIFPDSPIANSIIGNPTKNHFFW